MADKKPLVLVSGRIQPLPAGDTLDILGADSYLKFDEHTSAPGTPAAGTVAIYAKANGFMYSKDDAGVETQLGGGAGASEPVNQIVYGTGAGIDSAADLTYINSTGRLYLNTTDGTTGSVTSATAENIVLLAANASAGSPGAITVRAGNAPAGFASGGAVSIQGGSGTSSGSGGVVTISGGSSGAAAGSGGDVRIQGGLTTAVDDGSVGIGRGTTSTTRNGDFLYIPTSAGVPTGTPVGITGLRAMVYDTSGDDIYVYDGAWNVISGGGGGVAEPDNQIVYGSGGGTTVDSDADFTYNPTTGAHYVNSTTGTAGSVSVAAPGITGIFAASASAVTVAGAAVNVVGGAGNTSGAGGAASLVGGAAGSTGVGGAINITSGVGGSTSGNSGNINITSGTTTNGAGGNISITVPNSLSDGGDITLTGGTTTSSAGTFLGGAITITAGGATAGNSGSNAGGVTITGGAGTGVGAGVNNGGAVSLTGGAGTFLGGGATLAGGVSSHAAGTAGTVSITAGNNTGSGTAGSVLITAGTSAGTPGSIRFTTNATERLEILSSGGWEVGGSQGTSGQTLTSNGAGAAPTWQTAAGPTEPANQIVYGTGAGIDSDPDLTYSNTTGNFWVNTADGATTSVSVAAAGSLSLFAANSTTGAGGAILITAGTGNGANAGGPLTVRAGQGGATGAGGDLAVIAGAGGATSGNAGNVSIQAGAAGGTGTDGNGGYISIQGTNGAGTNKNGGDVLLLTGAATGTGTAGILGLSTVGSYTYQRNGNFSAGGDAQSKMYILRTATTDGTQTEMFLDGTGGTRRMLVPSDGTWHFEVKVVARRTDADNESAAYKFEGAIDNNAGTTALVGTVTETVVAEDTVAWSVTVDADNTNDALRIQVTGEAAKTIRWVAFVRTVETTG